MLYQLEEELEKTIQEQLQQRLPEAWPTRRERRECPVRLVHEVVREAKAHLGLLTDST